MKVSYRMGSRHNQILCNYVAWIIKYYCLFESIIKCQKHKDDLKRIISFTKINCDILVKGIHWYIVLWFFEELPLGVLINNVFNKHSVTAKISDNEIYSYKFIFAFT